MRRRFRRSSRARSGRETIWSGVQIAQDTVDSAAVSSLNIVDATDWATDGGFQRGAVLERIRGTISGMYAPAATSTGSLWMGVSLIGDSEVAPDPSNPVDYVEEDWLWMHVVQRAQIALTSIGTFSPEPFDIEVDIKSKRKLTKNSIVLFSWRASGTGADESFIMSAILRGLVKKP